MYEDMQASRRTWQTCISAAMEAGYHIMLTVMAQHSVRFVRPTVLCCAVLAVLCCAVLCSAVLCCAEDAGQYGTSILLSLALSL